MSAQKRHSTRRVRPHTSVLLAGLAALALVLLTAPGPSAPRKGPNVKVTSSHGTLEQSNSRDGAAIFTGAGMAPGKQVQGSVTITNTGTLAGRFTLSKADLVDSSGPNGGSLSGQLDVLVEDVTQPGAPQSVYTGKLGAMPARPAGSILPGASRTYRFTVSFPEGGSGDNQFVNSSMSVAYVWEAVEDENPPPPDDEPQDDPPATPPAQPSAPPQAKPGAPAAPKRPVQRPQGPPLRLWVPGTQKLLSRGNLKVRASCGRPCTVTARLETTTARALRTRSVTTSRLLANRPATLKLRLPRAFKASLRRSLRRGRTTSIRLTVVAKDDGGARSTTRRKLNLIPSRLGFGKQRR
jgi:spore coat-associated protein N